MQTEHPFCTSLIGNKGHHLSLVPSLVVSIHDVSTVTRAAVEQMIEDLAQEGVSKTSLLVIPDHHHRGRVDHDLGFISWLRNSVVSGHEAVLHGYYHLRPLKAGEGMATRLITRHYTAGEGEFHDVCEEGASSLLRRGKEVLGGCCVPFRGFIAPAWLLGTEAEKAVVREGFDYTTRIGSVIDCAHGVTFPSRSMVHSVRSGWRRQVSLLWNELLMGVLQENSLLRIGLHPPDWEHDAIRRHILGCIRTAAVGRQVATYGEWLDQWRSSGHEGGVR
jgi:hypothetical protein